MREAAVDLIGVRPRSLIETAVEKDAIAVDFKQVLRTGGGAGGTAEFEFHVGGLFSGLENTRESRPLASYWARRAAGSASTEAA